jgi:hypothetical protein
MGGLNWEKGFASESSGAHRMPGIVEYSAANSEKPAPGGELSDGLSPGET